VVLKGSSKGKSPNQVWVGKGIMFDTGGLSLKEKTSMVGMKNDMGGAAAVLSAFELACRRKKQKNLCAVLCLAENAIGPKAFRNDDIIELYSNRTIEINNTDAEGRLVLGDGVAYAVKHLNPSRIVDMATLTGAQLVATGKKHAAILCKDEKLEQEVLAYGRLCGDLVYPLLYCPELLNREFASEVADLKNSVRDRNNAQSSCAGHFIEMQLSTYQGEWLHIDIAGPAWSSERGTGYGVALLNMLI
jgi:probable aminopeptidase NPEPL1